MPKTASPMDRDRKRLRQCSTADRRASYEQIFVLVYRQMHALSGRWRPDFEDLVQVAAEQALRGLPAFRGDSELSTWTYQICYRTVLRQRRWYRRWLRRFSLEAPLHEPSDGAPDAPQRLEERERARRLYHALDRLSDKRRAVVVLRDLEGLPTADVAEIVGASELTVRSRLRDGRRQLGEILRSDPYFGEAACTQEDE